MLKNENEVCARVVRRTLFSQNKCCCNKLYLCEARADMNYNLFTVKNAVQSVESSNMWKMEALFQGHSPTWCLLPRSYVSCEEDERSEGTR